MAMKDIQITDRYTNACMWTISIEDQGSEARNLGKAIETAAKEGKSLAQANMAGANMAGAYMAGGLKIRRILSLGPIGSRDATLVVWILEDGSFRYSTGCHIQITEEAFRKCVVSTHGGSVHGKAYMETIEYIHRIAGVYNPLVATEE